MLLDEQLSNSYHVVSVCRYCLFTAESLKLFLLHFLHLPFIEMPAFPLPASIKTFLQ